MKLLLVLLLSCLAAAPSLSSAGNACGGTFRGFQYTITSPNYPRNYPAGIECIYRLQGESTPKCEQQFHLQFLDFNLKASEACRSEYLQVGDKHFYCGNGLGLRKFTGTNNTLIVRFRSDGRTDTAARGFKILVDALPCSLRLSPLKNPPAFEGIPIDSSRSILKARDVDSTAYRSGIRNDNVVKVDNSALTRVNLLSNDVSSSIQRGQIGSTATAAAAASASAAAFENNSIINNSQSLRDPGPRITSYLFLPPKETGANVTLHYNLGSSIVDVDDDDKVVASPSSDLLPPSINAISNFSARDADVHFALDKKIGTPSRNYGEPGLGLVDYELQVGNDCDNNNNQVSLQANEEGTSDRINYGPVQTANGYSSSPSLVYDPRYGLVPSNGYPAGNYPSNYPTSEYNPGGFGSGYYPNNPSSGVYNPNAGVYPTYPSGYPGGTHRPNYNPTIGGGYPGTVPGAGIGSAGSGECCRVPSTRRFSIVSPGFPGGSVANSRFSCRYTIVKSSPDVCRLRLNFRFFNFGADDPYCSLGYVDIDGQRFCGCRTGQSFQILFSDYIAKTISVFGAGYQRSRFAGFLIDVVQESCGSYAGYNPGYPSSNPIYPNYVQRRSVNASAFIPSPVDPSPLVVRNKRGSLGYSYPEPNVPFPINANKVQTHERFFAGNCQSRLLFDWAVASKEAFFKNARCTAEFGIPGFGFGARLTRSYLSSDEGNEELAGTDCEEINEDQGEIKSPLYPNLYPGQLKKCYKFNKVPNFCKLELYVRDFDLESSQDCTKDYLSFSVQQKKYCGRSLNDYRTVFDLTRTDSLQVDFVSDDRGTGRGFDIGFSQLPCELQSASSF